jgi:hypothetical protein
MGKVKDLKNQTYGRLTVVDYLGKNKYNKAIWICECECGELTNVIGTLLVNGHTKSCGCLKSEAATSKNISNKFRTEYEVEFGDRWKHMMGRCYNKNHPSYINYGARGIEVCEEWHSMTKYCEYIGNLFKGKSLQLEVDRIDNNGNYSPNNIKLSTKLENMGNTRRARYFEAYSPEGIIYISNNINDFSRKHGLTRSCVQRCLTNQQKYHFGWKFSYKENDYEK